MARYQKEYDDLLACRTNIHTLCKNCETIQGSIDIKLVLENHLDNLLGFHSEDIEEEESIEEEFDENICLLL